MVLSLFCWLPIQNPYSTFIPSGLLSFLNHHLQLMRCSCLSLDCLQCCKAFWWCTGKGSCFHILFIRFYFDFYCTSCTTPVCFLNVHINRTVLSSYRDHNDIRRYLFAVVRQIRCIHVSMPTFPCTNTRPIFSHKELVLTANHWFCNFFWAHIYTEMCINSVYLLNDRVGSTFTFLSSKRKQQTTPHSCFPLLVHPDVKHSLWVKCRWGVEEHP